MRSLIIQILLLLIAQQLTQSTLFAKSYHIDNSDPYLIKLSHFETTPQGGDTIYIAHTRTKGIIFEDLTGDSLNSIVITNKGGQVNINDSLRVLALNLRNGNYVKITGKGDDRYQYGFKLASKSVGISLSQLSSHIEIENVEINHDGFFGIVAKEDYKGNPPTPIPVFNTLIIHDCLIKNVTEGMYIGETKTPGMEFKHVHLYNNIITETGREGIQISNGVEDIVIHNNLFYNNGTDSTYAHGNNLQIGDNTVADVYENIFIGAYQYGVITLGKGDINIYNNYFEQSNGIFIDNRKVTDTSADIAINSNFFYNTTGKHIIQNYNQENPITISDNVNNSVDKFYDTNKKSSTNTTLNNNIESKISKLKLRITANGTFQQAVTNDNKYYGFGPLTEYLLESNNNPEIVMDSSLYRINVETNTISFNIIDSDNDIITTRIVNSPNFINLSIKPDSNIYKINVDTRNATPGVYSTVIEANDDFGGFTSKSVSIKIENISTEEVITYPNPFTSNLTLKSDQKILGYRLYTTNGQLYKSAHSNDIQSQININVSSLPSGTYIIETQTSTGINSKLVTKL